MELAHRGAGNSQFPGKKLGVSNTYVEGGEGKQEGGIHGYSVGGGGVHMYIYVMYVSVS